MVCYHLLDDDNDAGNVSRLHLDKWNKVFHLKPEAFKPAKSVKMFLF